jgi:prepilin-type N-terminal cleavage/methylation domain-containing protein
MKGPKTTAFSLVEVLIVVAILSVIAVTGYRSLMYLTKEATQTSRAAANSRRAEYDRYVGVLNDRLGRSWSYTADTASAQGLNGASRTFTTQTAKLRRLWNLHGRDHLPIRNCGCGGAAPLNLEYMFTNQNPTLDSRWHSRPMPRQPSTSQLREKLPPLYYRASTIAFRGCYQCR